jgi:hypothetical protein
MGGGLRLLVLGFGCVQVFGAGSGLKKSELLPGRFGALRGCIAPRARIVVLLL